jgi:soluble lytic murein transglycosylase
MVNPHGRRAFALLQIGQTRRAEAELRCLWPEIASDPALRGATLRVAEAAGLVDLSAQLAGLIETAEGRPHDDARFPSPPLKPTGGFRMDPSMVYALTRLESNFDSTAVSAVGARGLMQVMPMTASYMTGHGDAATDLYTRRLHDPATNLSIGQSYVMYLAKMDGVDNDLIRLLASYNAGPTSFARMAGAIPQSDDPLLFIESIPNEETRGFVPRALTYTWIYAARLHLPAPSLDELAAGAWPVFHAQSSRREAVPRLH